MRRKNIFVLVEASKLSLGDEFMQYQPGTAREKKFKEQLTEVIKRGINDFYRPIIDPSFSKFGNGICYVVGQKPAVGKSYRWWEKKAKAYWRIRKSRLGTRSEYIAFLGCFIKELVAEGWTKEQAWYAVCVDSKKLGNYGNFNYSKNALEFSGSRFVGGFFDLANAYKILAEDIDNGGLWLAGGDYCSMSYCAPLADRMHDFNRDCNRDKGVGLVVLEK